MARRFEYATEVVLLVIFVLCGCSRAPQSPLDLARQIANADRVVLTNPLSSTAEFSGVAAQRLVQAISLAKKLKIGTYEEPSCPGGFYIKFYSGTNLLAQIAGHDDHFHTSEGYYHDSSGVLQAAWLALSK